MQTQTGKYKRDNYSEKGKLILKVIQAFHQIYKLYLDYILVYNLCLTMVL